MSYDAVSNDRLSARSLNLPLEASGVSSSRLAGAIAPRSPRNTTVWRWSAKKVALACERTLWPGSVERTLSPRLVPAVVSAYAEGPPRGPPPDRTRSGSDHVQRAAPHPAV